MNDENQVFYISPSTGYKTVRLVRGMLLDSIVLDKKVLREATIDELYEILSVVARTIEGEHDYEVYRGSNHVGIASVTNTYGRTIRNEHCYLITDNLLSF